MLTATGAGGVTRLAADAAAAAVPAWWNVVSGLLLAAAGAWATWAQFVYPKIAERRARREQGAPPPTHQPANAPADLVGGFFADQARRLDAVLDDLETAHRKHARDAGAIARLTSERDQARQERDYARRHTCQHLHPGRNTP